MTEAVYPPDVSKRYKDTLSRRINNFLVYSTIRRAIRDCKPEGPILIAPCGWGWFFDRFRRDGIDFVGTDIEPGAIRDALRAVTPKPDVREADILNLPFADGQFDFVLNNRFLPHFEEDSRIRSLKELARVTRRYILAHYERPSLRIILRRLRGVAKPRLDMASARGWKTLKRADRRLFHDRDLMAAEGAQAGLEVKRLYYVSRAFSDRVYCLYAKAAAGREGPEGNPE